MTTAEAVAALDALTGADPEADHDAADAVLLAMVPAKVREAYERLVFDRADWWATA
jgi:hypothetical protein